MSTIYTGSSDQKKRTNPKAGNKDFIWNFLTVLLIIITLCIILFVALLFHDPTLPINPFPKPTLPVQLVLPTSTPTLYRLPATWTPEFTQTTIPTKTQSPFSQAFTPTETSEFNIDTPAAVDVQSTPAYPFALQSDPSAINAEVLYPERACRWMGVGGQVLDLQGRPLTGMTIQVGGVLENVAVNQTSLTGLALKYGEAGYEFELAKMPTASEKTLWLRMIDQANLPLSPRIYFNTTATCDKNLVIINFKQIRE